MHPYREEHFRCSPGHPFRMRRIRVQAGLPKPLAEEPTALRSRVT